MGIRKREKIKIRSALIVPIVILVITGVSTPVFGYMSFPNYNYGFLPLDNEAKMPTWVVGDSWTYHVNSLSLDIDFEDYDITLKVRNGEIDNLESEVDDIQNGFYEITFESDDVEGNIPYGSIPGWWGYFVDTSFSGEQRIRKSDLAIDEISIHMEGYIKRYALKKWFEIDLSLDFIPNAYKYLDFPITNGKIWYVEPYTVGVDATFYLQGYPTYSRIEGSYMEGHTSECVGVGDVSVEAGTFEAFHIDGGLGGEYYYAPAVFNTIKMLGEDIGDGEQIVVLNDIDMELKSYDVSQNHPPYKPDQPSGPTSGYVGTLYSYSTSTTDPEGNNVKYGWDWDGDLNVDDWSGWYSSGDTCTMSHSWSNPGDYEIRVKAEDTNGAESFWSDPTITEVQTNPPYEPSNPNPPNGATGVDIDANLSWTGGDPDPGDTVTYDVYFGDTSPPPQVAWDQSATTYDPSTMSFNITYYWQIVAWDNHGASASGPIWNFTTEGIPQNHPPYVPSNPDPPNHATGVDARCVMLSWSGGDPDPEDTVRYRIEFKCVNCTTEIIHWGVTSPYGPFPLSFNTTYRWRIMAKDNHGACSLGPYWYFTTCGNNTPNIPSDPIPPDGATWVGINSDLSWNCSDPDEDPLTYDIYFGTSSTPPLVASGQSDTTYDPEQLEWNVTYYWKIVAFDNYSNTNQSPIWHFTTGNNPPSAPVITGTTNGAAGTGYEYVFASTDPDGDDVYYYIDWGDNTFEEWGIGPYASGIPQIISHTWAEQGTYTIKAKTKDVYGAESDWGYLDVAMPVNQQQSSQPATESAATR